MTGSTRRSSRLGPKRFRLLPAILLAPLAPTLCPPRARALDYDIPGFTRFTYHYHDNLPLSPSGLSTQSEWLDMRISVTPRLHLGEDVVVALRIDALDGVVAGDGRDELDVLAGLDGATADENREGDDLDSIDLDRAWLEYTSSAGLLRIGRQGSQWGLGLVANEGGEALEWGLRGNGPGHGDTVDRASFVTDLFEWLGFARDHLLVGAAYDRVHEGNILVRADDVSQWVVNALYTNGTIRPRAEGTREAGFYGFYVMNHEAHADLGLLDVYGRAELGPERYHFYGELEGAWQVGSADRRGLVPDALLDSAEAFATRAFAKALVATGLDSATAQSRAAAIAAHGTESATERAAVTPALAESLAARGWEATPAQAVAERMATEGIHGFSNDQVTVQGMGAVARVGAHFGPFHCGLEVGGTSDLSSSDVSPPLLGPIGSGQVALVDETTHDVLEARELEAALLGRRSALFGFDRELDPALILFEEVGPLGRDGDPTVSDAFYLKLFGEVAITDELSAFGLMLYGQLATKYPRFRVDCGSPADCRQELVADVVPAGAADELGVEIDAGVTYHFNDYLTAEIRGGYLIAGHAFGPDADDVIAFRPQIGAEW